MGAEFPRRLRNGLLRGLPCPLLASKLLRDLNGLFIVLPQGLLFALLMRLLASPSGLDDAGLLEELACSSFSELSWYEPSSGHGHSRNDESVNVPVIV
jgi:hypothetical protein